MNKKGKKEQLLIGALIGIFLLVIMIPVPKKPEEKKEVPVVQTAQTVPEDQMEVQLKKILQQISGVGKVEVLITYKDCGKIIVEKDQSASEELVKETDSAGGTRTTTTNRTESQTVYGAEEDPVVIQELTPEVEGVLVVAQGAGNAAIKKQITETIEALFGLDRHKISIMKMEVSK